MKSKGVPSEIIVPSTKLVTVNVHKLMDTSCSRYYFWRWVMNIVPRGFNINFWFGSVMHKGFELIGAKKKLKPTMKAMRLEDKAITKKTPPESAIYDEVKIQRLISELMISGYRRMVKQKMSKFELGGAEIPFRKKLRMSPVIFVGTLDAWYKSKAGKLILFEGKTAKAPNNEYFRRLKFDKQINGYALALKDIAGRYPRECYYTVIRKPQIRQRKDETLEDFIERLEGDLEERKDWYFIIYKHLFGIGAVKAVLADIEWMTFDLVSKYDYLSEEQLMSPDNWPRNDHQCFNYGTCPYFTLCSRPAKWPLYLRFYTMRDIRYTEEQEELCPKREYSVKQISKMKGSIDGLKKQGR